MVISSRTPEGRPGRCPICGAALMVEPSDPPGDAPCPHCGHLVWFTAAESGDATVLRLTRKFVGTEAIRRLIASLDDRPMRRIVFDFGPVQYLDFAALAELIRFKKKAHGRGVKLTLRSLHPDLLEVFRITRLDQVFSIED